MAGFVVALSNSRARAIDTDAGSWFVSGLDPDTLEGLVRTASSLEEIRRQVDDVAQNATLVHVSTDGEHAETVHAYRSSTATRELYYLTTTDGTGVITDHFRTALAELAVENRTPSRRAIADHLLYRAPIPPGSFVSEIRSLEHGTWLHWHDADDRETTSTDHLRVESRTSPARATGVIDDALTETIAAIGSDARTVNLLSGGVDSTLLHTYLDGSTPALSAGIGSPEYAFEMEYAADAGELLEAPQERVVIEEADVLDHVERGIDALGSPSYAFPTVLVDAALRQGDPGTYTMAVGADALFGGDGTDVARITAWLAPLLSLPGVEPLARHTPSPVGSRIETLLDQLERLQRDPTHPQSYPQRAVAYTDPSLVGDFVGDDVVDQRCRRLLQYVRERIDGVGGGGLFAGPVELAHLISFYSHRIGSRYRQLAVAHGNPLVTPFETERLMRCALSIPVERRYIEGPSGLPDLTPKYLLKSLLEKRLPEYDVGREKGAGILPYERYRTEGALQNVFEKYDVPEFVPRASQTEILTETGRQSWNVLTYAIWRDRVVRNPDLEAVDGTRRFEYAF